MIGLVTSFMAWMAASRAGLRSSRMIRSTFSSTTIASSTTMPMASTMPKSVSVLIEYPSTDKPANVPMSETGTAAKGIMVARQFCRNR